MAVVWAKQAGNWTDSTLWAFWNETTQQIEDYGQVPQINDVVYCNGYAITINADVNNNLTITNATNPYTSRTDGYIVCNNRIVNANLISYNTYILYSSSGNFQVNGDIYISPNNGVWALERINSGSYTINGNIIGNVGFLQRTTSANSARMFINGNVSNQISPLFIGTSSFVALEINGNINVENVLERDTKSTNIVINGEIHTNSKIECVNLLITGNLYYRTIDAILLFSVKTLLSAPTKIICEDVNWQTTFITRHTYDNMLPTEDKVLAPTQYGAQMELVGTYTPDYPPESVVLKDYEYGDSDDRKTGTMEQEVNVEVGCVTPEDVRKDVPLVGMGVVGSLVVPSVDDVREGVHFDNDSVGTLIVQGGGDRLRIADFGYYTNAQSDTYIVDLTEQDKPKFAVAEERVLIEMFPDLDLENIPEKYFDDLFVKYLKYRLIVEYYRTAGINSTFTPSEPTTEIVNYQNVRNEVWLNSANIYLKAWGEKYPNSIKKQRIIL